MQKNPEVRGYKHKTNTKKETCFMQNIKAITKRGALFSAAAVVAIAAYLPAPSAYADSLNPLTDRSLTLSSSAPGWENTDGSGNATYAPPNSGANGQKSGNTFDFKISTDSSESGTDTPIKAFTFQYCTFSAGTCMAPGNNGYTGTAPSAVRKTNAESFAEKKSDLDIVVNNPEEVDSGDFGTIVDAATGDVVEIPQAGISYESFYSRDQTMNGFSPNSIAGNYIVYYSEDGEGDWTQSDGWEMTATNNEDGQSVGAATGATGKNNYIKLVHEDGHGFKSGTRVKIVFFANDTNYITNPGEKEFFVKINTYTSDTTQNDSTLVDGGVTVANVMNHSISIQTKVLETMDFSVGVVDPNTLESDPENEGTSQFFEATGREKHGTCDRLLTGMKPSDPVNVLRMGSSEHENALKTDTTYSTHSYWRLSSNSSAGATVYYSGVTLSNTVGDKIDAIGPVKEGPIAGKEQFGLAIANQKTGNFEVDYSVERTARDGLQYGVFENGADNDTNGIHETVATDLTTGTPPTINPSYHTPRLFPLVAHSNYSDGAGVVNDSYGSINTAFAFDNNSNLLPVPIASQSSQVVDCVTAKMRYIANIAATTPAGIYTTKVNYIAAPQY